MKHIKAYILLFLSAAGIVASLIAAWHGALFMLVHLIGSVIIMSFVLITANFRNEPQPAKSSKGLQKTLLIAAGTYNAILIITLLGMAFVCYQYFHAGRHEKGNNLLIPTIVIAVYAYFAVDYFRNIRRKNSLKSF